MKTPIAALLFLSTVLSPLPSYARVDIDGLVDEKVLSKDIKKKIEERKTQITNIVKNKIDLPYEYGSEASNEIFEYVRVINDTKTEILEKMAEDPNWKEWNTFINTKLKGQTKRSAHNIFELTNGTFQFLRALIADDTASPNAHKDDLKKVDALIELNQKIMMGAFGFKQNTAPKGKPSNAIASDREKMVMSNFLMNHAYQMKRNKIGFNNGILQGYASIMIKPEWNREDVKNHVYKAQGIFYLTANLLNNTEANFDDKDVNQAFIQDVKSIDGENNTLEKVIKDYQPSVRDYVLVSVKEAEAVEAPHFFKNDLMEDFNNSSSAGDPQKRISVLLPYAYFINKGHYYNLELEKINEYWNFDKYWDALYKIFRTPIEQVIGTGNFGAGYLSEPYEVEDYIVKAFNALTGNNLKKLGELNATRYSNQFKKNVDKITQLVAQQNIKLTENIYRLFVKAYYQSKKNHEIEKFFSLVKTYGCVNERLDDLFKYAAEKSLGYDGWQETLKIRKEIATKKKALTFEAKTVFDAAMRYAVKELREDYKAQSSWYKAEDAPLVLRDIKAKLKTLLEKAHKFYPALGIDKVDISESFKNWYQKTMFDSFDGNDYTDLKADLKGLKD